MSMSFQPVDRALDLPALEAGVLARWEADDVFAESLRRRKGAPEWVFYEGPPTANGRPGIHHVWARLFKDIYPRFQTMRGHHVARKGGWDCHGLPVEVEVEKELGFSGKPEIEEYGIEAFNARCRASVQRYVQDFTSLTNRIGMWLDVEDAYWTMDNDYIESVWWLFHEMWDKELLYEGTKVVPYCGRCGTALSSHELAQPGAYQDVTEPSVYVRFPVVGADYDLLVWTTTPWTLLSNVAAAVGAHVDYVRVRGTGGGRDLVLAADRVGAVLGEDAEVLGPVPVAELVGARYERPFTTLPLDADACRVVAADFVTTDDGSGIVHLAPAFGEIDREVAEAEGLPLLNPVDAQARFDASVPGYEGVFVKDADAAIIEALRESGRLEAVVDYSHSYPHCWRCGTPLIYWSKPTWFARTSEHKDELLAENESIGWHPEFIKHGRFCDWLENNVDWALSRDRFWGTPIPVWRCDDCGHDTCVGSVAQLAEIAHDDVTDLDLHRPFVDDVTVRCEDCGGTAHRVQPVLDAWFDSGSVPTAQFHYPFEDDSQTRFEERFPADFICEAIDQTRGWFYSLLAVNTLVFGRTPYRNVVCLALVVDQDGQKMSKSRGNVIDPWTVLDTRGADALRWNVFSAGSPWTPKRVFPEAIDETTRRFLLTLWNTYSFFVTYANIDGWTPPADGTRHAPRHVLDRWIRSRLHHTVVEVTDALDSFDALRGAQSLDALVDDLSNWYVRRSRPRFWKKADDEAHATLYESLRTITQLLAPFCPFVTDDLWANLVGTTESVHLTDWPEPDRSALDPALEAEMALAREAVGLGRSARTESKLKVRQPLRRALVLLPDHAVLSPEIAAEVAEELNVHELEPVTSLEGLLDYLVVPNFRTLGPKVGAKVPAVKAALAQAEGATVKRALDETGRFELVLDDGSAVVLTPDDVEVRADRHEEFALAQSGEAAVALDTRLDDELRGEGLARDVIRALNDHRKAIGLEIADRIVLRLGATGPLLQALEFHGELIAAEVLAVGWSVYDSSIASSRVAAVLDIDGAPLEVELTRP
ncbi:MAG: Isoleucyl-tRNA synthetase [Actinomycetia bacterium]|nr:Isoleucyl-tRNA synthetase [Actinomycetes bacterium]